MRDLDIIQRDSLAHTARRYGWSLTFREDGLVDLSKGGEYCSGIDRRLAFKHMIKRLNE